MSRIVSEQTLRQIYEHAVERNIPVIEDPSGEILRACAFATRPRKILEIGTAIGYSGLLMLDVSPIDCRLTTVDVDEQRLNEAENNFSSAGVIDRVKIVREDANYFITLLEDKFDFIFLDGPKAHYKTMFPYLYDLLSDNGMIFVDDVGYHGWVDDGEYPKHKHRTIITNMRAFLQSVENDKRLITQRINVGQGVLVVKKCTNPNY